MGNHGEEGTKPRGAYRTSALRKELGKVSHSLSHLVRGVCDWRSPGQVRKWIDTSNSLLGR